VAAPRPLPREELAVTVSCSWCHRTNDVSGEGPHYCPECGHRADLPMSDCNCSQCTRSKEDREAVRQKDMADLLKKLDAAGGDINAILP
jgi:hypothetical protein